MQHISLTPFGRQPVSAGHLAARALAEAPALLPEIDKWTLFNDLRAARRRFKISDRDLSVLCALLTFLPGRTLTDGGQLIVFPSNASLSDRAHGMAESTLRRHLAALVNAGLIARHDSPNGKRYASRDRSGAIARAFGFNLRPLLVRAPEIAAAAEAEELEALALARARETVVLSLRDAAKLIAYGREAALAADWHALAARLDPIRRSLRRRVSLAELYTLSDELEEIHRIIRPALQSDAAETERMSGNDSRNERHLSNTESNDTESEAGCRDYGYDEPPTADADEKAKDAPCESPCSAETHQHGTGTEGTARGNASKSGADRFSDTDHVRLPLGLVLKACPDILPYAPSPVRDWNDFIALARVLRSMMGISASAWIEAEGIMGAPTVAIVVAAMLQRITRIRNPGGYLRTLSSRAANETFSPGPMIMALLNT